ncbi:MAG: hypothetical protein ACTHJ9_00595 [Rhodanobacter sp.]
MKTRHARQIRYGVELALKHHRDRRDPNSLYAEEVEGSLLDDIQDEERDKFLTSRLEVRAYWATRVRNFGMGREASRQGAAV